MPSPPEQDPPRPGSAWPNDPTNRRPERRRYGTASAFAAGPSSASNASAASPRSEGEGSPPPQPPQPVGSYGSFSGGRASGSQGYGYDAPNAAPDATSSQDFSQGVYDQHDAAQRHAGRPPEAEALRGRGERREVAPGAERRQLRRHTDWPNRPADAREAREPGSATQPDAEPPLGGHAQHNPFDPDYRQWRDEQMRQLDRDYAQWRKERYEQFSQEFSRWRSQRDNASANAPRRARPPEAAVSLDHASALSPAPPEPPSASSPGPVPGLASTDPLNAAPGAERPSDRDWTRERDPARASPADRPTRTDKPGANSSGQSSSGGLLSALLGGHSDRKK